MCRYNSFKYYFWRRRIRCIADDGRQQKKKKTHFVIKTARIIDPFCITPYEVTNNKFHLVFFVCIKKAECSSDCSNESGSYKEYQISVKRRGRRQSRKFVERERTLTREGKKYKRKNKDESADGGITRDAILRSKTQDRKTLESAS
jgi:hypothetical protein